jgi:GT2 family glycosyltransferase
VSESKIYAIIVTYNGETLIKQCLTSLRNSNTSVNIVVVDNASEDSSVNIIESDFPEAILFKSATNSGFGHANNIGIKYAYENYASYILLLNQDAIVEADTIKKLVEASRQNPEYYIMSPVHMNKSGTGFDRGFMQYALPPFCENFFSDMFFSPRGKVYSTTFVNAAAWMIRREAISDIGFFDPLFFHYGEDRDYCNRLLFHNKKIGILSDSIIYHSRETTAGSRKSSMQTLRSDIYRNYFLRLIELKNLARPVSKQCFVYSADLILSSLKNCLRLRLYKALTDILTICKMLGDLRTIVRHRKECSTIGQSFGWSIRQQN